MKKRSAGRQKESLVGTDIGKGKAPGNGKGKTLAFFVVAERRVSAGSMTENAAFGESAKARGETMYILVWWMVTAGTWYLAGLYQMGILSLIFLAEVLLFVGMLPCSLCVKRGIGAVLALGEEYVNCGQKWEGYVRIENRITAAAVILKNEFLKMGQESICFPAELLLGQKKGSHMNDWESFMV